MKAAISTVILITFSFVTGSQIFYMDLEEVLPLVGIYPSLIRAEPMESLNTINSFLAAREEYADGEAGESVEQLNRVIVHYRRLDEELVDEIIDLETLVQYSLHHPEIF